ncbi:MAG: DEAD/DEAH box helicase [Chloroflexi bacterium SZAS-1]|nr:DEAD/DEAH box helicase [Chloroflexi bacterium SZAS-1]HNP85219.1 DEAD/DEAH box helicase [Kouleothrix sp.]
MTATPTTSFTSLGLSEPTLRAIGELGYEEPTPIQARTITKLMAGGDVIAQAQTGTGKTAAFALPIIEQLDPELRAPQALVMTPTRELAVQVAEAFHSYGKFHQNVAILPVYGGQPIDRQLRALRGGVNVVVGTPGRLLDHIQRGTLKLDQVRTVVLDEADEMLDMGFIEDIEAILKETPAERQTALFSATMPGPIAALAKNYMRDPERITIQTEHLTVPQIRQIYYEVGGRDKFEVLARVLDFEMPTSAIIFCRTKSEVDSLGERLIARAFPAETLHGDLSQIQRDRVMQRFRTGQVELLVATDVAARGLDIEHVSHVINYDIPIDPEVYVHRIGRTGRAGRTGSAITLVTPRERRQLRTIERLTNATIQRMHLPTISDVIARRRESFKETLRETITSPGLEPYQIMAEELGEEYSPTDLAAAAFKLLLDQSLIETDDPLANYAQDRFDEDREPRQRRTRTREFGPSQGMTRLYIDVGRDDNVRPADIVGAIANEAGIPGRAIGAIELFERFALVEVPSNAAEKVLRALRHTTIRGRKIAPSIARPTRR